MQKLRDRLHDMVAKDERRTRHAKATLAQLTGRSGSGASLDSRTLEIVDMCAHPSAALIPRHIMVLIACGDVACSSIFQAAYTCSLWLAGGHLSSPAADLRCAGTNLSARC